MVKLKLSQDELKIIRAVFYRTELRPPDARLVLLLLDKLKKFIEPDKPVVQETPITTEKLMSVPTENIN